MRQGKMGRQLVEVRHQEVDIGQQLGKVGILLDTKHEVTYLKSSDSGLAISGSSPKAPRCPRRVRCHVRGRWVGQARSQGRPPPLLHLSAHDFAH